MNLYIVRDILQGQNERGENFRRFMTKYSNIQSLTHLRVLAHKKSHLCRVVENMNAHPYYPKSSTLFYYSLNHAINTPFFFFIHMFLSQNYSDDDRRCETKQTSQWRIANSKNTIKDQNESKSSCKRTNRKSVKTCVDEGL